MSVSHERKIQSYPCNKYFCLFKAYFLNESNTVGFEQMAKKFFDAMPEKEIQRLQELYRTKVANKKK